MVLKRGKAPCETFAELACSRTLLGDLVVRGTGQSRKQTLRPERDGEHSLPVVVRAALAHVQFETIQPFLDGNGRQCRLLIVLMLIEAGVVQQPLLYLSLFFKQYSSRYNELLDRVRQQVDWEAWLAIFLEGVGRSAPSVLGYRALRKRPLTITKQLMELSGLSFPPASKVIETLVELGIAREITGGRSNLLFHYKAYQKNPSEGAEPLSELDLGTPEKPNCSLNANSAIERQESRSHACLCGGASGSSLRTS